MREGLAGATEKRAPILFHIAGAPVQAYGLLLGLAFLVAGVCFWWELRRRALPTGAVAPSLAVASVVGLAGARGAAWLEGQDGLNYLGGFFVAAPLVLIVCHAARLELRAVVDAAAPGLCFAYATARIGCQLAGDGDYGAPSALPWAMAYPNGTVPTLELVHPTPLYEAIVAVALGAVLMRLARRPLPPGTVFALYLVVSGVARFLVEEVRRNPTVALGLTQAQILSFVVAAVGFIWVLQVGRAAR